MTKGQLHLPRIVESHHTGTLTRETPKKNQNQTRSTQPSSRKLSFPLQLASPDQPSGGQTTSKPIATSQLAAVTEITVTETKPIAPGLPAVTLEISVPSSCNSLLATLSPPLQRVFPKLNSKPWRWSLVWICALGLFGGMGTSAYLWLTGLPPLPNCQNVTSLSIGAKRLYCAQEKARSGKLDGLVSGIALLEQWSPEHPLYQDAKQAISEWSALILLIAREKMDQSDLKGAVNAANHIPKSSPVYAEAQEAITQWQQQWQQGEERYAKALYAMKQQDWKQASEQVWELGRLQHDYWRLEQADILSKQIVLQKQARDALTQAQKLAKSGKPDQLGEAIVLAQKVTPETDAWTEAQTALQQWSQTLITTGLQQWQQGDLAGAITLAQQLPLHLSLPASGRDLVQFSHASKLVEDSLAQPESWQQKWNLWEAVAAVRAIPPESLVYDEAQAHLQQWQTQLQDSMQLQAAHWIASLGQRPALEFAITQAEQVEPDRPKRLEAQTFIAQWRQQIEQSEDRPYLTRAQQFAASEKIPDLQRAIAQATQIPSDRALWQEVQHWVEQWTNQIETIEDQPFLDEANQLANQKKLEEAILAAENIRPDRALYDEAQAAVDLWKGKIRDAQIAEDQPLMDQAYALAAKTHLTEAIDMANQIALGRALYPEAQASIAIWLKERDAIWKWSNETGTLDNNESVESPPESEIETPFESAPSADVPDITAIPEIAPPDTDAPPPYDQSPGH